MIFVFDIDDTLCDTDGYSEKYISKFFENHNIGFKQVRKVVRYAEMKFDWTIEQALAWYKTYGDQMALEFPPKRKAKEVINTLHSMGHKIILATARDTDWHVEPEKITRQWLALNGIKFDKLYIGRVDKEQVCIAENADVFVDDDVDICTRVLNDSKTAAYLSRTDYNETLEKPNGLKTVNDLSFLLDLASEMEM